MLILGASLKKKNIYKFLIIKKNKKNQTLTQLNVFIR